MATEHQIFAINPEGKLVAVADVANGLACGCICQICKDALIAKQGDIRAWYFAHQGNAECSGGPETLLHQAAKQVLLEARAVLVPVVVIGRSVRGEDGAMRYGKAIRPPGMLDYTDPEAEVDHVVVRPDVQIAASFGPMFVEIAVTNPVSGDKFAKLLELGVPTLEITLRLPKHPGPDAWGAVRQAVLHASENRRWRVLPEVERLAAEAIANAELPPAPPVRRQHEFNFGRTAVSLRPGKKWLAARVMTSDFVADPLVTGWLTRWGGRFDASKGVWWFRLEDTDRLRAALTTLAQRIAQHSPAEQHQRVLEAYYQAQP